MRTLFAAICIAGLFAACAPATKPVEVTVSTPTSDASQKLMTWSDLLSRPKPSPTHEISIGEGTSDKVDLWLPDGSGPHPVVLMVHGGCWQKEIADRTLMNYAAEDLRQRGLAVWNIEYRGVDEEGGGYPGTFLDAAAATDALRDYKDQYNLNLSNIVAFGHSAGGHLSLWLAGRHNLHPTSPLHAETPLRIATVINSGGLADLERSAPLTLESCLPAIMDKLTGAPSDERPDVFWDTSPVNLLPMGIEQVSVNGDRDRIAPSILGQEYTATAKRARDEATHITVLNSGHVELISPGTTAFDTQTELLEKFLK